MCRLLSLLGRSRVIIVSPYSSASMILVAKAMIEFLGTHESIALMDGGGFRVEVLENLGGGDLLGRIRVYRGLVPGEEQYIAAYNAGSMLSLIPPGKLVVASTLRLGEVPRNLRRDVVAVRRVEGNLYLLRGRGKACMAEISVEGVRGARPRGYEARALSVLARASAEYGPLALRDAVDVLSAELGLDRRRARSLLARLAERKLVVVEKGSVLVDYNAS